MPYIFKPHWYNNKYYIDGGILNNYPVQDCIYNGAKKEDILGIRFNRKKPTPIVKTSNILDFSRHLHRKLIEISRKLRNRGVGIENEIIIPASQLDIQECFKLLGDQEHRSSYINFGKKNASDFLTKLSFS